MRVAPGGGVGGGRLLLHGRVLREQRQKPGVVRREGRVLDQLLLHGLAGYVDAREGGLHTVAAGRQLGDGVRFQPVQGQAAGLHTQDGGGALQEGLVQANRLRHVRHAPLRS